MTFQKTEHRYTDQRILSYEESLILLEKAQAGDMTAQNTLVERNIALIKSIVKKFLNRGYEYEDLFQIGSLGIIKAIKNYNNQYNVKFSTYAVPMIIGEIKRFLRDDGMVKVSRSLKEIVNKVYAIKEILKKKLNRDPSIKEISEVLGLSPEEIIFAMESTRLPASIYDVVYEDDDSPILLIDKIAENTGDENHTIERLFIKQLLMQLAPRERQLIILRYFKDKTQSETAKILGVSQVQVSRLESKILKKMKESDE